MHWNKVPLFGTILGALYDGKGELSGVVNKVNFEILVNPCIVDPTYNARYMTLVTNALSPLCEVYSAQTTLFPVKYDIFRLNSSIFPCQFYVTVPVYNLKQFYIYRKIKEKNYSGYTLIDLPAWPVWYESVKSLSAQTAVYNSVLLSFPNALCRNKSFHS